jgi:hypothetical protein
MAVTNALAYYNTATIMAAKISEIQRPMRPYF